ncbi:MAG: hypothetical protein V2A74_08905, partial [bacterium]
DREAPLPDLAKLEADLRAKLPSPLPPETPLGEILRPLIEEIQTAYGLAKAPVADTKSASSQSSNAR